MEKRKRAVRWLFFLFSGNTFSKAWWIYLKKKVIIFLCFAGIFLMKTCLYNLNSALNYNEEGTGTFILNALKIAL